MKDSSVSNMPSTKSTASATLRPRTHGAARIHMAAWPVVAAVMLCLLSLDSLLHVQAFSSSSSSSASYTTSTFTPLRSGPGGKAYRRIHGATINTLSSSSPSASSAAFTWKQRRQPTTRLHEQPPSSTNGEKNDDTSKNSPKSSNDDDATALISMATNNHHMDESNLKDYSNIKPQVVPQRWVQLAYLSLLALLSDWVCFSVAAAPSTFETNFHHSAASIIDIFLFTNVATSFLVTDVVTKFGLQRAIQGAALFMMAGCWLRAGVGFIPALAGNGGNVLVDYSLVVAGTVLVGIAQPFFQCTPPLLSAKWFANNERSTSTAIALNFNQIGIATAFLVGGAMASSTTGLENYFGLIACVTTLVTIGTLLQFQNEPPFPPSTSELEKLIKGEEEPPFLESVQTFFATKGFTRPLAAFICSISITNVVGVSNTSKYICDYFIVCSVHVLDGHFTQRSPCFSS
jgi:Major Facilitator Superfamily